MRRRNTKNKAIKQNKTEKETNRKSKKKKEKDSNLHLNTKPSRYANDQKACISVNTRKSKGYGDK